MSKLIGIALLVAAVLGAFGAPLWALVCVGVAVACVLGDMDMADWD